MRGMRAQRSQRGQMLVGVMVLLAIVFLLGSAMALGVSGSLHQVDQGANQDAARYAAESAVARGQSFVRGAPAPTIDGCSSMSSTDSLNGQPLQYQPCAITAVDAGPGKLRYYSQSETLLATDGCLSVPLSGGTSARKGGGDEQLPPRDARVWTSLAWRSTTKTGANLVVFVDDEAGCDLTDEDRIIGCAATAVSPPLYMHCAYQMASDKPTYMLSVKNTGGPTIVSDFIVRDAVAGHDCVATVIGTSTSAIDEGDLVLPGTPMDTPVNCGVAGARLGLRNRLLP